MSSPRKWGCSGEMKRAHFRWMINIQWLLLSSIFSYLELLKMNSVLLILSIVDGVCDNRSWFGAVGISYNLGSVLIGMLVAGFGTSIYTSQKQEGMDMAVKKSMFNLLVRLRPSYFLKTVFKSLFFLFVLFGNILFDFLVKLPYDYGYVYEYYEGGYLYNKYKPTLFGLKITIVVIYFILFFMNLVTLIMQVKDQ